VEFKVEGFTKIVSDNVFLKHCLFLQLLMVLSEGRRYELTKMLMYHNSLKTYTYSFKKRCNCFSVVTFISEVRQSLS